MIGPARRRWTVFDGQVGLVLKVDGEVLLDKPLGPDLVDEPLSSDLVDELLTVTNEEGSHLGEERSGVEASEGTVFFC